MASTHAHARTILSSNGRHGAEELIALLEHKTANAPSSTPVVYSSTELSSSSSATQMRIPWSGIINRIDEQNKARVIVQAKTATETPLKWTTELAKRKTCDCCSGSGPIVTLCRGGCDDAVCASCVDRWLDDRGYCEICRDE